MLEIRNELAKMGHLVVLPKHTEEYAAMKTSDHMHNESVKNKVKNDLIREYYREIGDSDSILVINENINGVKNYIGGNSFLEMGFAHVLNKKIFLLNPIPDIEFYKTEIEATRPVILDGDLEKIESKSL